MFIISFILENCKIIIFLQCFTHRHLGWKIRVVDECDATDAEESRVVETLALPDDLMGEESIQVQSRLRPESKFLDQRKKFQKIINTKQNYNDFSSNKGDSGLSGEVYPEPSRNYLHPSGHEYELPISKVQIKEVIEAVESLEDQMKNEIKRNTTYPQKISQYQVHEDVEEFVPEQPIREGDEYVVETAKLPETFLLPPNQKPQTLHNVLRPNSQNKPMGNMRPPFRRPTPPEIKLRRPFPMHPKGNSPYPLSMPNQHGSYGMSKNPNKHHNNRPPSNMNRPQQSNVPPMKAMPQMPPPKPVYNQGPPKHAPKIPNNSAQSIIIGKPGHNNIVVPAQSQTLSLGHTDIIANQVVKSQITLPGSNDAVAPHSVPQIFFNKPGQIILGKPMDHPKPLDQQMLQNKPQSVYTVRVSSTPSPEVYRYSSTMRTRTNENHQHSHSHTQNEMKSSDFIGESTETSSFAPAQNTGFKPDSIVIESGFKPIIREPLMASEDKIAEYDNNHANRREDTDVEEDYEEAPQYINSNHAYPSDKITQSFEPMFIPSPPDHLLSNNDRTKEVFPSNHAKEDRPHPVYIKTESELNALFGKKNMDRESPTDMVMESDKLTPQYLPPAPKIPKEHSQQITADQTFTTYDGKTISAATLTSVPEVNKGNTKLFSSKLPANTELLLKTPQFGPFKGEIPPVVADHIKTDTANVPVPVFTNTRSTHLKLVNSVHKQISPELFDLKGEGSEKHEEKVENEPSKEENKEDDKEDDKEEDEEEEEEEYEEDGLENEESKRRKRDTKAAQFEMGKIEEGTTDINRKDSDAINHVDFEIMSSDTTSITNNTQVLTYVIILILLKRFF